MNRVLQVLLCGLLVGGSASGSSCRLPGGPDAMSGQDLAHLPESIAIAKRDLRSIAVACRFFRNDHGRWPRSLRELVRPPAGEVESYLATIPIDPWGNSYQFENTNRELLIYSLGADELPGGRGIDADLYCQKLLGR